MNGVAVKPWQSSCWSPEKAIFVALSPNSDTSNIMSSPDGLNWTPRTNPTGSGMSKVCWSPEKGLFVAVSALGIILSSPDGIVWTQRSAPASRWSGICWSAEKGLFVAVANFSAGDTGPTIATSPDGINWTGRTNPIVNNPGLSGICWSAEKNLFVAMQSGSGKWLTSSDGINWTERFGISSNSWGPVCWSPEKGLFVAVSTGSGSNQAMTSVDGLTWIERSTPAIGNWRDICWSPEKGLFVAVSGANNSDNKVITSPDAINWTARSAASNTNRWAGVCWAAGRGIFVAVAINGNGSGGDLVMASRDGIVWSSNPDDFLPVTGVEVTPSSLSLEPTQTHPLVVSILPPNAGNKNVSFVSGNSEVATVNSAGLVTGIAEGTATITVTTHDGGFTATCEVTVGNAPPVRRLMYIIKL